MLTLENYIMESEINDATVGDIYVEQALAEMEVAYALAATYTKDTMFVEYMSEMYGEDSEIVQEGKLMTKGRKESYANSGSMPDELKEMVYKDEKRIKRNEKLGSLKERIKAAPGKAWEFIKSVAAAIATAVTNFWHFITEKSLKSCVKKLKELPGDKQHQISPYLKEAHKRMLMETKGFCDTLDDLVKARQTGDVRLKSYKPTAGYIYKATRENSSVDSVTVSTSELIEIFERLASDDSKHEIKAAIKKVKDIQKLCDKQSKTYASNMDDKDARKKYKEENKAFNQETMKTIKEDAKAIVSAYSELIREYRSLANKVLKEDKAAYKADKKYHEKRGLAFGDED